ncbi:MAG: InlB B-repeat-containing protein, partial [Acholeplasmatales bacterium]|nr:InlB B-repeat-containing protein [Acholeplasmatales bacterium]
MSQIKSNTFFKKGLLFFDIVLLFLAVFTTFGNELNFSAATIYDSITDGISVPSDVASLPDLGDLTTTTINGMNGNASLEPAYKITTINGMTNLSLLTQKANNVMTFKTNRINSNRVAIYLLNDLDYTGLGASGKNYGSFRGSYNYDQIGSFRGTAGSKFGGIFHGLSHTITGIYGRGYKPNLNADSAPETTYGGGAAGLFGVLDGAVISSLTLIGKHELIDGKEAVTIDGRSGGRAPVDMTDASGKLYENHFNEAKYGKFFDVTNYNRSEAYALSMGLTKNNQGDSAFVSVAFNSLLYNLTADVDFWNCQTLEGGILGTGNNTTIIGAVNRGYIFGYTYRAGGILGGLYDGYKVTILNSVNYGTVDAMGNHAGGIIGDVANSTAVVKNCVNYGTIISARGNSLGARAGGIVAIMNFSNDGSAASRLENVYTYYGGEYRIDPYVGSTNPASIKSAFANWTKHRDRFGQYILGCYRMTVVGGKIDGISKSQIDGQSDLGGVTNGTEGTFVSLYNIEWTQYLAITKRVAQEVGFQAGDAVSISDSEYLGSPAFLNILNANAEALRTEFVEFTPYFNSWFNLEGFANPALSTDFTISHKPFDSATILLSNPAVTSPKYYFKTTGSISVSVPFSTAKLTYQIGDGVETEMSVPSRMVFTESSHVTLRTYNREVNPTVPQDEKEFDIVKSAEVTEINDVVDLYEFAISVNLGRNYEYKTVHLRTSLDLSLESEFPSNNFIVIGETESNKFSGTFDGHNYSITNIHTNRNTPTGLFGYLNAATIKNLNIGGRMPGRGDNAAGLFGKATSSTIINVNVNINVEGVNNISGFGNTDGTAEHPTLIIASSNNGAIVSQNSYAAGFSSQARYTKFYDCFNNGTITVSNTIAGGIVGSGDYVSFDACANKGVVTPSATNKRAAGIAGIITYRSGYYSTVSIVTATAGSISNYIFVGAIINGTTTYEYASSVGNYQTFLAILFPVDGTNNNIASTLLLDKRVNDRVGFLKNNIQTIGLPGITSDDIYWLSADLGWYTFEKTLYPTNHQTHVPPSSPTFESSEINSNINNNAPSNIFYKDLLYLDLHTAPIEYFSHYAYSLSSSDHVDVIHLDRGVSRIETTFSGEIKFYNVTVFGELSAATTLTVTKTPDKPESPVLSSAIKTYYDDQGGTTTFNYEQISDINENDINRSYYALQTYVYVSTLSSSSYTTISRYEYATNLISPVWVPLSDFFVTDNTPYFVLVADKTHTLYVRSVNSWGVVSDTAEIIVVIDGTAPKAPKLDKNYQGNWALDEATVFFTAEDNNIGIDGYHFEYRKIRYSGENPSWTKLKDEDVFIDYLNLSAWDQESNVEGTYYIQARTISRAGVPSDVNEIEINLDGAAPTVNIVSSNPVVLTNNIVLEIRATDGFGIKGLRYGWAKVYSLGAVESAIPNWNDELTYQVDENEAYYVAFVKDGLERLTVKYLLVENYRASRPTSPVMKAQLIEISKTPGESNSWVPFKESSAIFDYRSTLPVANLNALVFYSDPTFVGDFLDSRYYYRFTEVTGWTNGLVRIIISHGTINYETTDTIADTIYRINNSPATIVPYGNGSDFHFYLENMNDIVRIYGATRTTLGISSSLNDEFSLIIQAQLDSTAPSAPSASISYANYLSEGRYTTNNYAQIALLQVEELGFATKKDSGVIRIEYSLDKGVTYFTYDSLLNISALGDNEVYIRQIDRAGNIGNPGIIHIIVDKVKPTSTYDISGAVLLDENEYIASGSVTIQINTSDYVLQTEKDSHADPTIGNISKVEYSFNADDWETITYESGHYTFVVSGNGNYSIFVRVTDKAGNVSDGNNVKKLGVIITNAEPVVNTIFNSGWLSAETKTVNVYFSTIPGVKVVSYDLVMGEGFDNYLLEGPDFDTQSTTIALTEGTYGIVAHTNVSTFNLQVHNFEIDKLDTVSPEFASESIINISNEWSNQNKSGTLNFTEPNTNLTYYVAIGEMSLEELRLEVFTSPFNITGNGIFYIYAKDLAANITETPYVHYESKIDNIAPVVSILTGGQGFASFGITDGGGSGIYGYTSTIQGNAPLEKSQYLPVPVSENPNVVPTVSIAGAGTVYLWAIDNAGNVSLSKSTIIENIGSSVNSNTSLNVSLSTVDEYAKSRKISITVSDVDGMLGYYIDTSSSNSSDTTKYKTADFYGNLLVGHTEGVFYDFITDNSTSNVTYYVHFMDLLQNKTNKSISIPKIDSVSPVIGTITETIDGGTFATTSTITITASDANEFSIFYGWSEDDINLEYSGPGVVISSDDYDVIWFRVVDIAGNEVVQSFAITKVDTTDPFVVVEITNDSSWTNVDKEVSFNVTDLNVDSYTLSGPVTIESTSIDTSGTYSLGELSLGSYVLTVTDKAGNVTISYFEVLYIDKSTPSITLDYSSDLTKAVTVTVSVSNEVDGVIYRYKLGEGGTYSAVSTFSLTSNNSYNFYVINSASTEVYETLVVSFIDNVAPIINSATVINGASWSNVNKDIVMQITDSQSPVIYVGIFTSPEVPDAGAIDQLWNGEFSFNRAAGTYYIFAKDSVSNISNRKLVVVDNIETEAPVISLNSRTIFTNSLIRTIYNLSDAGGSRINGYYISSNRDTIFNEELVPTGQVSTLTLDLPSGTYYIALEDNASNRSEIFEITVWPSYASEFIDAYDLLPLKSQFDIYTEEHFELLDTATTKFETLRDALGMNLESAISDITQLRYNTYLDLVHFVETIDKLRNGTIIGGTTYKGYEQFDLKTDIQIELDLIFANAVNALKASIGLDQMTNILYSALVSMANLPIEYSITYELVLDDVVNPNSDIDYYTIRSSEFEFEDATKDGYTFLGWYTASDYKNKIQVVYHGSTGNLVLWAKWVLTDYNINYYLDGGVNNVLNPYTFNILSDTFTLEDPSKDGYSFVGWFNDQLFESEFTSIVQGTHENVDVYAKFEAYEVAPKVTNLSSTGNANGSISYSWTAPDTLLTVDYYEVSFASNHLDWVNIGDVTSYTRVGLVSGNYYYFAIRAVTEYTKGLIENITTYLDVVVSPPGAVTVSSPIISADGYKFELSVLASNGSQITGFKYSLETTTPGSLDELEYTLTTNNYVVFNLFELSVGTTYYLAVYATSNSGDGTKSYSELIIDKIPIIVSVNVTNRDYNALYEIGDFVSIITDTDALLTTVYEKLVNLSWVSFDESSYDFLPGTYRVKVSYTEDEEFQGLAEITKQFTVSKTNISSYEFTSNSVIYTGSTQYPTITNSLVSFDLSYSKTQSNYGSATPLNAGVYYVRIALNSSYSDRYTFTTTYVIFTINRKEHTPNPGITPSFSEHRTYQNNITLSNISLSDFSDDYGYYVWVNLSEKPIVSQVNYLVRYVLVDTENYYYSGSEFTIELHIDPVLYSFTFSDFGELFVGDNLPNLRNYVVQTTDVVGTFSYIEASSKVKSGTNSYDYKWIPSDPNYSPVYDSVLISGNEIVLHDIYVDKHLNTVNYKAFETINTAGLIVKARYNHGEEKTIPYSNLTIVYNVGSSLVGTDTYVTIRYEENGVVRTTTEFVVVTKINLVVNVTYSGPTIYSSTPLQDIELTNDKSSLGTVKLDPQILSSATTRYTWKFTPNDVVNYQVVTGEISLTIVDRAISSIVQNSSYVDTYNSFDVFNRNGLSIKVIYNDSTFEIVSSSLLSIVYENATSYFTGEDTYVTIIYLGVYTTLDVTVNKLTPNVSDIILSEVYLRVESDLSLTDIVLPEGYEFLSVVTPIQLGENTYRALYTGSDTINYTTKEIDVTFVVKQVISDYTFSNLSSEIYSGSSKPAQISNTFSVPFVISYSVGGGSYVSDAPINAGTYYVRIVLDSSYADLYKFDTVVVYNYVIQKFDITGQVSTPIISTRFEYSPTMLLSSISLSEFTNDYGSFTWVLPASYVSVIGNKFDARFTLSDSTNYVLPVSVFRVTLNVDKKSFSFNFTNLPTLYEGDLLPDLRTYLSTPNVPSGTISYDDDATTVRKGSVNYAYTFTPDDQNNYETFGATIRIKGEEVYVIEFTLSQLPYKTSYFAFESAQLDGIELHTNYNHGTFSIANLSDFDIVYQTGRNAFTGGDTYFRLVYKANDSLSILISVSVSRIELDLNPTYSSTGTLYTSSLVSTITLSDSNNTVPGQFKLN